MTVEFIRLIREMLPETAADWHILLLDECYAMPMIDRSGADRQAFDFLHPDQFIVQVDKEFTWLKRRFRNIQKAEIVEFPKSSAWIEMGCY